MPEFSLFSTQIPYIIFVAVYMLYCGLCSLNKHDLKEYTPLAEEKASHITSDTREAHPKTFIYGEISEYNCIAEEVSEGIQYIRLHFLPNVLYIPDVGLITYFPGNSLFSRPPPMFC